MISKIKDETSYTPIKEFVELRPKMYSFLADDSSDHKKTRDVNENVVATTISCGEYKNVLLNKKCLRHSINRIQRENHRLGT